MPILHFVSIYADGQPKKHSVRMAAISTVKVDEAGTKIAVDHDALGDIYVQKSVLSQLGNPSRIRVTIEVEK